MDSGAFGLIAWVCWTGGAGGDEPTKDGKNGSYLAEAVWEESMSTASTYDCPVCRKAQLMDLDRITVRPALRDCVIGVLTCVG